MRRVMILFPPVWWLVILGSWWIWTPTQCIVVTHHGRAFHLDVEEGLPTLTKGESGELLNDTINDHVQDSESQRLAIIDSVQEEFIDHHQGDSRSVAHQQGGH